MRRWLVWIGIAISFILVFVSLRALKLEEVWGALRGAQLVWVIPGIIAYFVAVLFRTFRWRHLLRPRKLVSVGELYRIIVIGYMGNNIYPARIGELLRAYVLRRDEGVPIAYSIATVLIERIVDGLVMVAFVLIGLPRVPNLPAQAYNITYFAGALMAVATLVFFWFALRPKMAERLAHAILGKILPARLQPPIFNFVSRFVEGAGSLRSPFDLAYIVGMSVIAWLIETVKYFFVMKAFALDLPFVDLMLVNGVANLFTIIPSGPGFVGTFDAAGIGVLSALGVPSNIAGAYTLALHAVLWLPVTLVGAFFMLREGLHWNDLQKAGDVKE
ncbi:MAG TPA: lysylphosphatidylglycerol synthase transmembrane domain-containing protein [Thermoflexales bacterium]|nr:lysylphosphatidylglycerol synthase transmembrane domain-containing protein [Thermoflexales bacterium]